MGEILGVCILSAIIASSHSDVSPPVMFRRNREHHLENMVVGHFIGNINWKESP